MRKTLREVLVVAYYYPPQRGIGGKRIARWVEALPSFGFRPWVLTTPLPPPRECDDTFLSSAASEAFVLREYCPERVFGWYNRTNDSLRETRGTRGGAGGLGGLQGRLESWAEAHYPFDPKVWFVPFAVHRALRLLRERPIEAVLVTVAPYSSVLVGLALAWTGLPLVLDFRDPWSFNFEMNKKAPLLRSLEARVERKAIASARKVILASGTTCARYQTLYPQMREKFVSLYSGFTPDLPGAPVASWPGGGRPRVGIVHFGEFYGPRRLGVLIDALARVVGEENLSPSDLRILLLGGASPDDLERAEELGVRSFLEHRGALPYQEGLSVLRGADALLYCDFGREPYFILGKFFDYLRVGRPVLALSASEELRRLMGEHGLGRVVDPEDVSAMVEVLRSLVRGEGLPFEPRNLSLLSAEASARSLARILEEATDVSRGTLHCST